MVREFTVVNIWGTDIPPEITISAPHITTKAVLVKNSYLEETVLVLCLKSYQFLL